MRDFLNTPFKIGSLTLKSRLIQGPLAGFSCAPFRELFYLFEPPAYCVSEMLSAHDVVHKHELQSRYLRRSLKESILCYQISGNDARLMTEAAIRLEALGADMIDINCGCPKAKIRKKGAGSALLEAPETLAVIVSSIKKSIRCPLSVKIRLQGEAPDLELVKRLEDAGADALIIHGRRWQDNYDTPVDFQQIAALKQQTKLPVIANGDICDYESAEAAWRATRTDALMIARAGTGKPWLYASLLKGSVHSPTIAHRIELFMMHLEGLAELESEYQAVLQSKKLVRYYFKAVLTADFLQVFYNQRDLMSIEKMLAHQLV
ncbi:nitrogen regulation protein [Legionella geestiana]|uniref:tRNA-dihydrouridine synthase n=1 Tax=Legionella geestiana TaxID=45065 RepID=A0A0W0UAH1_9GAMM|nr:tRNA-dihydrouridine synthase family protein [Legionella geestiana]KTD04821.1 nitrogen regulation protein [Legionella geestiana]QBS11350.1 tRNA-dihydrouridine synthase family protein [Legionella geestiana]STX54000.1 nitrogen regulation protein [Legionella geestiana]